MTPDLKDVAKARKRLHGVIHQTPVYTSRTFNERCQAEVHFKCENFQKVGAFKARGAYNAISQLGSETKHVVTHSSGNHGAAVAWAARETGRAATVICPENASKVKRDAIQSYGGNIVDCGDSIASREEALAAFLESSDATFIHPYDDANVIAGQGTAAGELLEAMPELEEVWVPVGGGGLCAGSIVSVGTRCRVVGCEPVLARDAFESMQSGQIQNPYPPKTIADGLRSGIGRLNFEIMHQYRLEIVLVNEDEILKAMRLVMRFFKIVIEPSAAVPIAGILKSPEVRGKSIGVIVSGGNFNPMD